jgi:hypothetical protein
MKWGSTFSLYVTLHQGFGKAKDKNRTTEPNWIYHLRK